MNQAPSGCRGCVVGGYLREEERDGVRPRETIPASNVAAMSLPLGTLLLFTAWWPASLCQLMEQASNIIPGLP